MFSVVCVWTGVYFNEKGKITSVEEFTVYALKSG